MNDLDHDLRDALSARAAAVAHDPDAYGAIVRRRRRRGVLRWTRPVAAATACLAVVGVGVAVGRAPERAAQPTIGGGSPAQLIALRRGETDSSLLAEAVVLGTGELAGWDLLSTADGNYTIAQGVAAVGDGKTFYAAVQSTEPCTTTLLRLEVTSGLTEVARVSGWVQSIAVSRDGRKLAYSYSPRDPRLCQETATPNAVGVKDLESGAERTWTSAGMALHLAWSPDARHLAYDNAGVFGVAALDTTRPPGPLPEPPRDHFNAFMKRVDGACVPSRPAYLPNGELAVLAECRNDGPGGGDATRVRVFDVTRDAFGRELFRLPNGPTGEWLALDRTGRHALVGMRRGEDSRVYYWDGSGSPERIDMPDVEHVAW